MDTPHHKPLVPVSIILPVYNARVHLAACIMSIAEQTVLPTEIICINDGSTDNSFKIIQELQTMFPEGTVKIHTNVQNIGLTKTLNIGLAIAKNALVARIDSDDIWLPEKLEMQMQYMEKHPECGIIGCWYINKNGNKKRVFRLPITDTDIRTSIFHKNPFGHSCVLFRKELVLQVGNYNHSIQYGQDRDLWFRLLPLTTMHNIPQALCIRNTENTISTTKSKQQLMQNIKTRVRYMRAYGAPVLEYLYLIETLGMMIIPQWIRNTLRNL